MTEPYQTERKVMVGNMLDWGVLGQRDLYKVQAFRGSDRARLVATGLEMTGEQRLWLSVALQAVAEQDMAQIRQEYGGQDLERMAAVAREYVASAEFDGLCELASVDPNWLRKIEPAQASEALTKLNM